MTTGGRRCLRPGNTIRNGGMQRAVVEAVQPWRTSFEGSMADMKAGSRVPKEGDTGRISKTLPPGDSGFDPKDCSSNSPADAVHRHNTLAAEVDMCNESDEWGALHKDPPAEEYNGMLASGAVH